METPSPEPATSTSPKTNEICHDDRGMETMTRIGEELERLKQDKKRAEVKLQVSKRRYEEELAIFNETRVENIFKNSGAREYFEQLKEKAKHKEGIIKGLREELDNKSKELEELKDKCKEVEKQSQEYLKAWKDAQKARERLEMEKRLTQPSREARSITDQVINKSSSSSFVDNQVPPPPLIEAPSVEEIFRTTSSYRELNPYSSLDSSIPPPPNIEVPLDEILDSSIPPPPNIDVTLDDILKTDSNKKAYEPEKGQFLCHIYLSIDFGPNQETLSDIIELIEAEQTRSSSSAFQGWHSLNDQSDAKGKSDFHVTLLRGHRTIHYHHIKPLVSNIETHCRNLSPFNLCFDKLRIFYNYEKTKQFLCIAASNNPSSAESSEFVTLKQKLQSVIDQFADRSTEEDETDDTVTHCSIMSRDVQQVSGELESDLKAIENLCNENLDDYPICFVKVDSVNLKIGQEVYNFRF